ncbi:MAG: biotin/lipoyl-binding protein [Planctomycetes bacterium]|nr:biotin/lipoyl-binding protein [Planctomycetota bacterium]
MSITIKSHNPEPTLVPHGCLPVDSVRTDHYLCRPDLIVRRHVCADDTYFVVKDPINGQMYRFAQGHYTLLTSFDGKRTVAEIIRESVRRDTRNPEQLSELESFVGQLIRAALIIPAGTGNADRVLQRAAAHRARQWKSRWNILYVKLPAFDPDRLLTRLQPVLRAVFEPTGVLAFGLLVLLAIGMVVLSFRSVSAQSELLHFRAFFNVANLFWLWLALGLTKILHEFGHALSCKHFGGECHEMGIVLMMFTPCLYCDVSDVSTFQNKWHRIFVSTAGIYVELAIASIAALVWCGTVGGIAHNIAFALMAFCSVNTLLVNANPLMRFDGYYILSDLLEIPNLRQKAQKYFQQFVIDRLGLGAAAPPPAVPHGRIFIAYAVASTFYRWIFSGLILWGLHQLLQPYGLGSISLVLALCAAILLIVFPILSMAGVVWRAARTTKQFRGYRFLTTALILGMLGAGILLMPIPRTIHAAFTLEPCSMQAVFAPIDGRLISIHVSDGQFVRSGDCLATLENTELEMQVLQLEHEVRRLEIDAERLRALGRQSDCQWIVDLAGGTRAHLKTRRQQLDRMVLRAECDGVVVLRPQPGDLPVGVSLEQAMTQWRDSPLLPENQGCFVNGGTIVCELHADSSHQAVLVVDQTNLEFLEVGQACSIQLDAFPTITLSGEVTDVARREAAEAPQQLARDGGGALVSVRESSGIDRPLTSYYRVQVRLQDGVGTNRRHFHDLLIPGFRGRAVIHTGSWTCWQQMLRLFHASVRY